MKQVTFELPLTMPTLYLKIRKEKNGVTTHYHEEEGHSWTRNAWNWLFQAFSHDFTPAACGSWGPGCIRQRHVNDGYRSANVGSTELFTKTNTNSQGIIVGTGTDAFDVDDYNLSAHNTDLSYNNHFGDDTEYDSSGKIWTHSFSRSFTNDTVSAITITEIGIHTSIAGYRVLVARDLLDIPVTVDPTETLFVTYQLSSDFSDLEGVGYAGPWTRNAWNVLFGSFTQTPAHGSGYQEGSTGCRRFNSSTIFSIVNYGTKILQPSSSSHYGIVVGTGNQAFSRDDHALQSQVTTNWDYGSHIDITTEYDAIAKEWVSEFSRTFINQTGANVTIRESGVVISSFFLGIRNVLPVAIELEHLQILRITYRIKKDFSEID